MICDLKQYKNPFVTKQYVAPYGYCFYNANGDKLGRVIWVNNVDGVYIDKCYEEWGL